MNSYLKYIMISLAEMLSSSLSAQQMPPSFRESATEPVKYTGSRHADRYFYYERIPHATGVHSYQAYRANRSNPPEGGMTGWTYGQAPMIAYWNGRFWLQYLSNLKEEHNPPSRTLITTSVNGRDWTVPRIVFPEYVLPEIETEECTIPAGMVSIMHQRMEFYISHGGRLLTIGFYSYCLTPRHSPNLGQGARLRPACFTLMI